MLGAVLAGGESRRLGYDKAGALLGGEPLWRRQFRVLRSAGAEPVVLVRRPGQETPDGPPCWRDVVRSSGPLGGLHAALSRRSAPWVAVLAVDMPGIDAAWFRWLRGFCRPGVGAMARHASAVEPLAAIYPAEALAEIAARLQRRDLSLQRLALALASAGRMTLLPLPASRAADAESINTPAQRKIWQERDLACGRAAGR